MKNSRLPIALLSLVLLTALAPGGAVQTTAAPSNADAGPSDHPALRQWLERNIPSYMEEAKMPGFSIAVVQNGETIYAEGFGLRDPQGNLPATADTLYGIGSITKSFVAIGILQLVDEGKIRLTDPVSQHIPFELGLPGKPITIHHLLTHSQGIPSLGTSSIALYRGLGHDTGIPFGSADDFYRFVNGAGDEIVAEPGVRFFYHNGAWRMLGHIIQEKSGMPFHQYVQRKVIEPIGMRRTTFDLDRIEADPDHIVPHLKDATGKNQPANFPYPNPEANHDFSFLLAAGGIVSSVNEMTLYMNALIDGGAYEGGRLASKKSIRKMQRPQIQRPNGHYGRYAYGYGLGITSDFLGHEKLSHGGSIIVTTAYMAIVPDIRAGVVMMGNASGMSYSRIADSALALLMGKNPDDVIPALQIRKRMKQLAGDYAIYRGLDRMKVIIKGGMLYMEYRSPLNPENVTLTPLIPEDPSLASTTFYVLSNGLKYPVEFMTSENGGIDFIYGRSLYHKMD